MALNQSPQFVSHTKEHKGIIHFLPRDSGLLKMTRETYLEMTVFQKELSGDQNKPRYDIFCHSWFV